MYTSSNQQHSKHSLSKTPHKLSNKLNLTTVSSILVASMALTACGGGGSGGSNNGGHKTKTEQTITFTAPATQAVNDTVALTASSDSKLPIVYTVVTNKTCSVAKNKVTAKAKGTCTITASQAGNASFKAAKEVSTSFDIVSNTLEVTADNLKANSAGTIKLSGKQVNNKLTAKLGDKALTVSNKGRYQAEIAVTAQQTKVAGDVPLIIKNDKKTIYENTVAIALPTATGDNYTVKNTGVTTCGNDTANDLDCSDKTALADYSELKQDGNVKSGATMAYTKIAHKTDKGEMEYCIYDNVSGLVWEKKTNDEGWRDKDWQYTWYDSNSATNGGVMGVDAPEQDSCNGSFAKCNSENYIAKLNSSKYCGHDDWRLPTSVELVGIKDFGKKEVPFINPIFENIYIAENIAQTNNPGFYLTSSSLAASENSMKSGSQRYIALSFSNQYFQITAPYKNNRPHSILAVRGE